jgi:hypothetical protein
MIPARQHRWCIPRRGTGFGLVDALVGLALLAVTLLGACGSLHFALRATRSAAWQARAVDLVADLNEDLQHDDPALPLASRLESWRERLRHDLPAGEISALDPRDLAAGAAVINWFDLRVAWNGTPGGPREILQLPVAQDPVR